MPPGRLLANHKVVAVYVFAIKSLLRRSAKSDFGKPSSEPWSLFNFDKDITYAERCAVHATMMFSIVHSIMCITKEEYTQKKHDLFKDLDYCLTKEEPMNLEWLCFAMHALCHGCGEATNTAV